MMIKLCYSVDESDDDGHCDVLVDLYLEGIRFNNFRYQCCEELNCNLIVFQLTATEEFSKR